MGKRKWTSTFFLLLNFTAKLSFSIFVLFSQLIIIYIKPRKISINSKRSYAIVNAEGKNPRSMNLTFVLRPASKDGILFYSSAKGLKSLSWFTYFLFFFLKVLVFVSIMSKKKQLRTYNFKYLLITTSSEIY